MSDPFSDFSATHWSQLDRARSSDPSVAKPALERLFLQYHKAVYQYAFCLLGDQSAADEVCSSFAEKLVKSRFNTADPARGRFRHLLKTVTRNLAMDHCRKRNRSLEQFSLLDDEAERGAAMDEECGLILLDNAWRALEHEHQREPWPPYYTVLRMRTDDQDASNPELAARLAAQAGRAVSVEDVNRWLHKARQRFAGLLVNLVSTEMGVEGEDLVNEVRELGLFAYCKSALKKRGLLEAD